MKSAQLFVKTNFSDSRPKRRCAEKFLVRDNTLARTFLLCVAACVGVVVGVVVSVDVGVVVGVAVGVAVGVVVLEAH